MSPTGFVRIQRLVILSLIVLSITISAQQHNGEHVHNAADDTGDPWFHTKEDPMMTRFMLRLLNSTILSVLVVYMLFALMQDFKWHTDYPWVAIPLLIPCFITCLCFYLYVGLNSHSLELLLLSTSLSPWILSSTFTVFVRNNTKTYSIKDCSSDIYSLSDIEIITAKTKRMQSLPQHEYLVSRLFSKLDKGATFSNWDYGEYQELPTLHPGIETLIMQFVGNELYNTKREDITESVATKDRVRFRMAKALCAFASMLFFFKACFLCFAPSGYIDGFLCYLVLEHFVMILLYIVFTMYTVKVMDDFKEVIDVSRKYRCELKFSWFAMGAEFWITALWIMNGLRDDNWSANGLILLHSFCVLGWYATWIRLEL